MTTSDPSSTSVFVAPSLSDSPAFGKAPTGGRHGPFTTPDDAERAETHRVHSGPEDLTEFHEVPVAAVVSPSVESPARVTEPIPEVTEADLAASMERHIRSWAGPRVGPHGVRRCSAHTAVIYALVPFAGLVLVSSEHALTLGRREQESFRWAQEHLPPGARQDELRAVYEGSFRRDLEFLDRHARVAAALASSWLIASIVSLTVIWPLVLVIAPWLTLYQVVRAAGGQTFQR